MFRRAKLLFVGIDAGVPERAIAGAVLVASISLTDGRGGPRCSRCGRRRAAGAAPEPTGQDATVTIERLNPPGLHQPPCYHHVTVVDAGRTAYLAGHCPLSET